MGSTKIGKSNSGEFNPSVLSFETRSKQIEEEKERKKKEKDKRKKAPIRTLYKLIRSIGPQKIHVKGDKIIPHTKNFTKRW